MVKRWAAPIIATLVGCIWDGAIIGLLSGILTALIWPPLADWWKTRRFLNLVKIQDRFVEEYDVHPIPQYNLDQMLFVACDSRKDFLLYKEEMRKVKAITPTKLKAAAERKELFDKEESRRKRLGFPSQSMRRDHKVSWPYNIPHYQHLKEGVKFETCWLCDQNNAEQDKLHDEIWGNFEREEAAEKGSPS